MTLSAKTQSALKRKIVDLHQYISAEDIDDTITIERVAFVLNKGRMHFSWRACFVVASLEGLLDSLQQVMNGSIPKNCIYDKKVPKDYMGEPSYIAIVPKLLDDLSLLLNNPVEYSNRLLALGDLYTKGYAIDWNVIHANERSRTGNGTGFLRKEFLLAE